MDTQTQKLISNEESLKKLPNASSPDKTFVLKCVRRWGGATSDAVLDPNSLIFNIPTIDGLIGYRMESHTAVVLGDPICATSDIPLLAHAFHRYCQEQHLHTIYIGASESFAQWAIKNICAAFIEFGEEIIFDPQFDPTKGPKGSLVRRKMRHAIQEGTTVKEYLSPDKQLEEGLNQVKAAWLQARRGPQVYISHIKLFENRWGKRWFYAQQGDRLVGILILNRLEASQGWLLNHLMLTPDAPHGTPELLIITAIETLRKEGCTFLTCSFVPSQYLGKINGLSRHSEWIIRKVFQAATYLLGLNGRKKFWEKFQPQSKSSYLLFSHSHIGLKDIFGLIHSLNVSL